MNFRLVAVALLVCLPTACTKKADSDGAAASREAAGPRLVILGFDGVDPRRVETLVKAGKLQNLKQLGDRGYRGALRTTNPPQSPVAWASFATGMPPGEHGVFDFIGRDMASYMPKIATTRVSHAHIDGDHVVPAEAENLRHGEAFWDVIARAGVRVRTHTVPYAYPPPADGAHSLAGLGTPDVRGINSSFTLLTADASRVRGKPPAGGQVALLESMGDGAWQAMVKGPRIRRDGKTKSTQTPVVVRAVAGKLQVDVGGQRQTLAVGETGERVTVEFVPSRQLKIKASTRLTVRKGAPEPELYVEPLSILPEAPYFPVSAPPSLAAGLWNEIGAFKTVGWVHDTSALGARAMDEQQFLSEAKTTFRWREKALLAALKGRQEKVTIAVFTAPDRIGHMFFRYIDPQHPARDEVIPAAMAQALDDSYLEMDRVVGEVQALLGDQDVLLVMSDHGFSSFRRGLNLNTWLRRKGYLVLNAGVDKPRDFFQDVDWKRTRAYAMGTGSVFLNLRGREGRGIVQPNEAAPLARKIADGLRTIRDNGRPVVMDAYLAADAFVGAYRREAPDIRVGLAEGYRASWATTLGGVPKKLFEDNTRKWSGDHASARPEDVPGILVTNRALSVGEPRIEDLSATAYAFTGVAAPQGTIGRALLEERR